VGLTARSRSSRSGGALAVRTCECEWTESAHLPIRRISRDLNAACWAIVTPACEPLAENVLSLSLIGGFALDIVGLRESEDVLAADAERVDLAIRSEPLDDLAGFCLRPVECCDDILLFHPPAVFLE